MSVAALNGQRIAFDDEGAGPAVVFSHGFFMDRSMFAPQVEALSGDYRCISVDARGFGETESDGRPFTYWDLADDLISAGLLDVHHTDPVEIELSMLTKMIERVRAI